MARLYRVRSPVDLLMELLFIDGRSRRGRALRVDRRKNRRRRKAQAPSIFSPALCLASSLA